MSDRIVYLRLLQLELPQLLLDIQQVTAWLGGVQLLLEQHDGDGEGLYLPLEGDDGAVPLQLVLVHTQQPKQLVPPLHDCLIPVPGK